jgi:hypothetical protein
VEVNSFVSDSESLIQTLRAFNNCVAFSAIKRYYYGQHFLDFSCWDQILVLNFGQHWLREIRVTPAKTISLLSKIYLSQLIILTLYKISLLEFKSHNLRRK